MAPVKGIRGKSATEGDIKQVTGISFQGNLHGISINLCLRGWKEVNQESIRSMAYGEVYIFFSRVLHLLEGNFKSYAVT